MKFVLAAVAVIVMVSTSMAQYPGRPFFGPVYPYSFGPYGNFGRTNLGYGVGYGAGYNYQYNSFGGTYYPSLSPYQSYNQFNFNYRFGYGNRYNPFAY